MYYPRLQEMERYREMTSVFGGYNHQLTCGEGQFYDMQNMTSSYYPVLSPRKERGIIKALKNPQGILDKEDIYWIDDKVFYKNGEEVKLNGVTFSDDVPKTMEKMGAYIVVMPDKIWYNTETKKCGYMENKTTVTVDTNTVFTLCDESGNVVDWHDSEYFEKNAPKSGDYMLSTTAAGKPSLKVYSSATGIWTTVASTYIAIIAEGVGKGFEKDDGVKITTTNNKGMEYIFVNADDDGKYSTNTRIVGNTLDFIVIPGIFNPTVLQNELPKIEEGDGELSGEEPSGEESSGEEPSVPSDKPAFIITVERKVPDMSFIIECNNRLWGCSKDGHEVYCCKLGDVTNWNCFNGISTDSWAATVGSDGKFTGAITYLGYPMFFKEDSLIKIAIGTAGGHQMKETKCRGLQKGSGRSLAIINETLIYKSANCVCTYNGSLPHNISEEFGDIKYYDAVASSLGDKYYISMRDKNGRYSMFTFDTKNGIWCKEDDTKVLYFCKHLEELYYIDGNDNKMKSIGGTLLYNFPEKGIEKPFSWNAESGTIGYSSPDNKYVARINLRITLEFGTNVDFYMQYDSNEEWEHKFNMSGKGTRAYSIPIVPRRCDHFKYKIVGKGNCKIHSITKTIEEGSDL